MDAYPWAPPSLDLLLIKEELYFLRSRRIFFRYTGQIEDVVMNQVVSYFSLGDVRLPVRVYTYACAHIK